MRLLVYGTPIPQGSMKAFTPKGWKRPILTSDNAKTKPWRQAIVDAAVVMRGGRSFEAPVHLSVIFYLPRPKSAPKNIHRPAKKPDLDKLVRAVCDALTSAGVWRDDCQVVRVTAEKVFAAGMEDVLREAGVPRAEILVEETLR